jgi:Holliday junction resolvase RusA-like endonuclease
MNYIGPIVSINRKYLKTRHGLCLAPEFREFKNNLILSFGASAEEKGIKYPIYVKILFAASARLDADCTLKTILDALQEAGIICNDKQVKGFQLSKIDIKETGMGAIYVSIERTDSTPSISLRDLMETGANSLPL